MRRPSGRSGAACFWNGRPASRRRRLQSGGIQLILRGTITIHLFSRAQGMAIGQVRRSSASSSKPSVKVAGVTGISLCPAWFLRLSRQYFQALDYSEPCVADVGAGSDNVTGFAQHADMTCAPLQIAAPNVEPFRRNSGLILFPASPHEASVRPMFRELAAPRLARGAFQCRARIGQC